jgi:2'-5' RNA ligase
MMRLFVAIDLDDRARQAIAAVQRRLAKALDHDRSIKWMDNARIHMTLAFIGEIADALAPPIIDSFSLNIGCAPFEVVLERLGVFPPRGSPRVLWIGVGEGARQLGEVQREVAARCQGLGLALEGRPFTPHLTLARWRVSARPRRAQALRVLSGDLLTPIGRITVDHVTLYQSRLSQEGSTYTALAHANLT